MIASPPLLALVALGASTATPPPGPLLELPTVASQEQGQGVPDLVGLPEGYVRFVRVPEGGTQPRLRRAAQGEGDVVLLFFRGEGAAGDLFVTRSTDEAVSFDPPRRVNAEVGSVPRVSGLHLAAFDLGPDGLAHVVWVRGSDSRRLFYAREQADGSFENIDLGTAPGMALGAAVAVDPEGIVYLFHGADDPTAEPDPETGFGAKVWLRKTNAEGDFGEPTPVGAARGVSKECPMDAAFDPWSRTLYAFFRTYYAPRGHEKIRTRDLILLSTEDGGLTYKFKLTDNLRYQPELTVLARLDLEPVQRTILASWEGRALETPRTVYSSVVRRNYNTVALPLEPKDGQDLWRCSVASAAGKYEDVLMAWVERPRDEPEAPAQVRWRLFQRERRAPLGDGRAPESCADSVPAVLARDGGYTVVY